MIGLYHKVSELCSKATTLQYSTSFSSAIKLLHADLRQPIHNIYGFVRLADEVVDSFHGFNKQQLLMKLKADTWAAIEDGISLNPILHSFQRTVNEFAIERHLIEAFFYSMELDLSRKVYDVRGYQQYIYGSAEVVGLMCLQIFCNGDKEMYTKLEQPARHLGAAFQKVNFLRDVKADFEGLDRMYFPSCDFKNFTEHDKQLIEADIQADFDEAYKGIVKLPLKARFGVYVAYKYYLQLFKKIRQLQPQLILEQRVRIPNFGKALIVAKAGLRSQLNIL